MHEPNEKKVEELKGRRGFAGKFRKYLLERDPCQHIQLRWIELNIPLNKYGRKFVKEYIEMEMMACLSSEGYETYANPERLSVLWLTQFKLKIYKGNNVTRLNQKVGRGPKWKWSSQDVDINGKQMTGRVIEKDKKINFGWWKVEWENGYTNAYEGNGDIVVIE